MKTLFHALAAGLLLSTSLVFADIPREIKQGDMMPDAIVKTADGMAVQLGALVAKKPSVLIFYRGGWCPFCVRHLSALQAIEDEIVAEGFQMLAISADRPEKIAETPNREKLTYTLLSDQTMEAAKAFGLTFKVPDESVKEYKEVHGIDLEAASGETHHLLPHPAVFIVDTKGMVRMAHVNRNYRNRLDPELILSNVREVSKMEKK